MARQRKRPARRPPFPLRLMHARPRLLISIAIGIAVTLALSLAGGRTSTHIILGWDAGVALYLLLTCILMARSTIAGIREHAARDDEGRVALLVLTVLAALASLGVIIAELGIGDGDKRTGTQLALPGLRRRGGIAADPPHRDRPRRGLFLLQYGVAGAHREHRSECDLT
jgi:uncharacterized membrane protein